jgi:hypothetical protein
MASQTRRGITKASADAERAAVLAEGESLVKTHDRLRLTPPSGTTRATSTKFAACERAVAPLLVLLPAGRSSDGEPLPSRTGTTLRRSTYAKRTQPN